VSIAHIDAVTQAMAHLSEPEKQQVAIQGNWINMVASHTTPDNFARAVRRAVQQIHTDAGLTQLEQQRRRTFLRHWVDRDSGMVCLRGEFDPESGLQIVGRLQMLWSGSFTKELLMVNLDLPINYELLVCVPSSSIQIPIPLRPLLLHMVGQTSVSSSI